MKTIIKGSALAFLVILSFTSCQKEVSNKGNSGNSGSGVNDSIYLSKYIIIDTTQPPGTDTSDVFSVIYDSQKRVKQTNFTSTDYIGGFAQAIYIRDYVYNGNDTLPYKITGYLDDDGIFYRDTAWLTYDKGMVISDSGRNYRLPGNVLEDYGIALYQTSGNNTLVTYRTTVLVSMPTTYLRKGNISKGYLNSNIIQQTDTSHYPNKITDANQYQLTYDNHPNPLYRVDLHYNIINSATESFDAQPNNTLTYSSQLNSATTGNIQYNYVYRADGYPVIARLKDLLDPTENRKIIFVYTHL